MILSDNDDTAKIFTWALRVKSALLRTALPMNLWLLKQHDKHFFFFFFLPSWLPVAIIFISMCARGNLRVSAFLRAHFINEVSVLTGNKSEDESSCSAFPGRERAGRRSPTVTHIQHLAACCCVRRQMCAKGHLFYCHTSCRFGSRTRDHLPRSPFHYNSVLMNICLGNQSFCTLLPFVAEEVLRTVP